jgi:hypothetical protein
LDNRGITNVFEMLKLHGVDAGSGMRSLHCDQTQSAFPPTAFIA